MILYRPLMRSVNLLSLTKYPNINRRAFTCTTKMMMMDKDNNKDDTDTNGRIWLHSPYQNTPRDTNTLSSQPAISRCPLQYQLHDY